MGQIFNACVYDTDNMVCYQSDVDKFHANCYSFSGDVAVVHYLLRQKAYRVMWGGWYTVGDIAEFSRKEDLLGLSIFMSYKDIENNNDDLEKEDWLDKAKFIGGNHSRWKRISAWEDDLAPIVKTTKRQNRATAFTFPGKSCKNRE